jgi:hypothetical protein
VTAAGGECKEVCCAICYEICCGGWAGELFSVERDVRVEPGEKFASQQVSNAVVTPPHQFLAILVFHHLPK